jgi:hypothetical protein
MSLTTSLLQVPPLRKRPTRAGIKARRIARVIGAIEAPSSALVEPVRAPWRWHPGKHERIRTSQGV